MVRANTFAEFVADLSADDKELVKDLKSAEKSVLKSSTAMQANLDTVSISSQAAGGGIGRMGLSAAGSATTMAALGRAAAFTGSESLLLTAQIGELGVAAKEVLTPFAVTVGALPLALSAVSAAVVAVAFDIGGLQAIILKFADSVSTSLRPVFGEFFPKDFSGFGAIAKQAESALRLAEKVAKAEQRRRALLQLAAETRQGRAFLPEELIQDRELREATVRRNRSIAAQKRIEDDAQRARRDEDRAFTERATSRRLDLAQFAALEDSRRKTAESVLIQTGAKPSEFIQDPVLKRLAQLGESLQGGQQAPPGVQGSFGLRRIGPGGALQQGQVLGSQQLNTAEKNAKVNVEALVVAKKVRALLERIANSVGTGVGTGSALQLSGRP